MGRAAILGLALSLVAPFARSVPGADPAARADPFGDPLPDGAVARVGCSRWWHGALQHVLYAPDGKLLATAGADGLVRFWDPATGKLLRRIADDQNRIHLVAFSPDGKLLATASYFQDGKVRLWDVTTGRPAGQFPGHREHVTCLAFAPDSRTLAVGGSNDNRLHLWDVATSQEVRDFRGHQDRIHTAAFSPDGKTVATGGLDRTVRLWATDSGKELRQIDYGDWVFAVAFSPDGKLLAAAGGLDRGTAARDVILWDIAAGKEIRRLEGQPGSICAVAFLPSGKTVAARGRKGLVTSWEAATGKKLPRSLDEDRPAGGLASLSFAPDGKTLASGGSTGHVLLWDFASGKDARPVPVDQRPLALLAFAPDGKSLLGPQQVWDPTTGKELRRLPAPLAHPWVYAPRLPAVFAPDRKTVATLAKGEKDSPIVLKDAARGEEVRRFEPALKGVGSLAFAPDGKLLASATQDGALDLWDTATGKRVRSLRGEQGWAQKLGTYNLYLGSVVIAFAPDGKTVAASGFSFGVGTPRATLGLWDVASGRHLRDLEGVGRIFIDFVTFAPDGKLLVTAGVNSQPKINVWEVATGKPLPGWLGKHEGDLPVAFSPDGKTLATAGAADRRLIWLWDVATGKERGRLRGHEGPVLTLTFSPDGKTLASGSLDTTALVWDVGSR
jgi:WD40 repeat protein